jgi:hypothetical protein
MNQGRLSTSPMEREADELTAIRTTMINKTKGKTGK